MGTTTYFRRPSECLVTLFTRYVNKCLYCVCVCVCVCVLSSILQGSSVRPSQIFLGNCVLTYALLSGTSWPSRRTLGFISFTDAKWVYHVPKHHLFNFLMGNGAWNMLCCPVS